MGRRLLIIFIFLVLAWLIVMGQLSLIDSLPGFANKINLILFFIVLVLFFLDLDNTLLAALALGVFWDIFSFAPFGFNLFLLLVSVFVLHILLRNWFTNRSFYTLAALNALAVTLYGLLSVLLAWLIAALGPDKAVPGLIYWYFWRDLFQELIFSTVLSLVFFNLLTILGRRLQPFFLAKGRN